MGLAQTMKVSQQIEQHVDQLGLWLNRTYGITDVKLALSRLMGKKKLRIQKTGNCPTLKPFFWYVGELEIGDKLISSSGEGYENNMAQIRCVGELFERIPLYKKESSCRVIEWGQKVKTDLFEVNTSNGLSFALNLKDGLFSSYRELIERQVILDYWLKKKDCVEVSGFNRWNFLNWTSALKNGLESKFYCLPNPYGLFVICCHLSCSKRPPYNIFGYGCHENIEKALEKAFLEAWRFYWEYQKLDKNTEFKTDTVKDFADHFYFYAYQKDVSQAFFPKQKASVRSLLKEPKSIENFKYDRLYIFDLRNHNLPGHCIKLTRNDFLEFGPGALSEDKGERKHGEVHPVA